MKAQSGMFSNESWRQVLKAYATRLVERFSTNLCLLSDTGISLPEEQRLKLTISPLKDDAQKSLDRVTSQIIHSAPDDVFFAKWCEQAKPLLIVAPFGCGKSVLLAHFACRLARNLQNWCEEPAGAVPWVPFPVRVRAWQGQKTFEEYLQADAQRDVLYCNADEYLSPEQFQMLRRHHKLLPLFDGLDELAGSVKLGNIGQSLRNRAIADIWQMFPDHHVLSSRPDHRTEDHYSSRGTRHELKELEQAEAEVFIRKRLDITNEHVNPLIRQYRAGHPHINGLFRRPLFLAAWCTQAKRSQRDAPITVTGLMSVVLQEALEGDVRMADNWADAEPAALVQRILDERHVMGAVLAIHADVGFGIVVPEQTLGRAIDAISIRGLSRATLQDYVRHSLKAGLLLKHPHGTYVQKIPVSEYLIGCYYAWLGKSTSQDWNCPGQRELVLAFQKRFWWPDHDNVWLYTFDVLWHGSTDQQATAGQLTEWVLNVSKACLGHANWESPLSEGQVEDDRPPFNAWRFAQSALLPVNAIPESGQAMAQSLIEASKDQLRLEATGTWVHLESNLGSLVEVAHRRPRLVVEFLLDELRAPQLRPQACRVADELTEISALLTHGDLTVMLDLLERETHKRAWNAIALVLVDAAEHLDGDDVKTLVRLLKQETHKNVWDSIATAIRDAAEHLNGGVKNVLRLLERERHNGASRAGSSGVEILLRLLQQEAHAGARGLIGLKVGHTTEQRLRPMPFKRVESITLSASETDEEVGYPTDWGIRFDEKDLERGDVKALRRYLREETHSDERDSIVRDIAGKVKYDDVRAAVGNLERHATPQLARMLTILIGDDPMLAQQLRDSVRKLGDIAAGKGEITLAVAYADILSLCWFVRRIDPAAAPGRRIVYGVAERHDPDLLLPADKRFAPLAIRRILGLATDEEEGKAPAPVPIGNREILPILVSAIKGRLDVFRAVAFKQKLASPSQLSRYLNGTTGKHNGAIDLIEASSSKEGRKLRIENAKGLNVDKNVLEATVRESSNLASELYELAKIDDMTVPVATTGLGLPIFECPFCSALNDPVDIEMTEELEDVEAVLRPHACIVCGARFDGRLKPEVCPDNPLWCPHCFANFGMKERKTWTAARKHRECSRKICQKKGSAAQLSSVMPSGAHVALQRDFTSGGGKPLTCRYCR